jgi:hypothetical protein
MDAVDILKICFRRWYVMLPILIGAAGVSYQLIETQETTYTAAASYGLVQPGLTGTGEPERNPLGSDGSDLVGAALEAQLNSRATQQQLGGETTRGWGPGESNNGSSYSVQIPMFETTYEVRAYGPDEQEVQDVVNRVIEAAPDIADDLQTRAGAPQAVRYEPFVLAPTQVDALPATSALKLVIAVMGVGTLVGAAWSIVADRLLRRRRVGGATAAQAGPAPSDEEDDSLDSTDPSTAARTATTGAPAGKTTNGQAGGVKSGVKSGLKSGAKPDKSGKTAGSTGPGGGRRDRRHQPLVRR